MKPGFKRKARVEILRKLRMTKKVIRRLVSAGLVRKNALPQPLPSQGGEDQFVILTARKDL
jgi:hypothetical protein